MSQEQSAPKKRRQKNKVISPDVSDYMERFDIRNAVAKTMAQLEADPDNPTFIEQAIQIQLLHCNFVVVRQLIETLHQQQAEARLHRMIQFVKENDFPDASQAADAVYDVMKDHVSMMENLEVGVAVKEGVFCIVFRVNLDPERAEEISDLLNAAARERLGEYAERIRFVCDVPKENKVKHMLENIAPLMLMKILAEMAEAQQQKPEEPGHDDDASPDDPATPRVLH